MKNLIQYIKESKFKFTVYLMVGIPGSGKSTWCQENHPELDIVSRDKIRAELGYTKNEDEKAKLSWEQENKVTEKENEKIEKLASQGKDFIIDDTNTGKFRNKLIKQLRSLGGKVIGVKMNTPVETCIKRRKGQIPEDIMREIYKKQMELSASEVDDMINVKDNTNENEK